MVKKSFKGFMESNKSFFKFSNKTQIHLFSSGYLRGRSFGSGSIGSTGGIIGALIYVSYFCDLYKSANIFGSKSGTLLISSNDFFNEDITTCT